MTKVKEFKGRKLKIIAAGNFILLPVIDFFPKLKKIVGNTVTLQLVSDSQLLQLLAEKSILPHEYDITALFLNLDCWLEKKTDSDGLNIVSEICEIIKNFGKSYLGNILIFLCPTKKNNTDVIIKAQKFINDLKKGENIFLFSGAEIDKLYPCKNIFNSYFEEQLLLPYTQQYYNNLTTYLIRMSLALYNEHKVIAVDADNTLWTGICGENSLAEIKISSAQHSLQILLKQKKTEGFLICLCSNNNIADVIKVFEQHKDMLLSIKDFDAIQVNWCPKHEKFIDLAKTLNLGLASFVFIDDNPLEIEQIETFLPEITTIAWPVEEKQAENLLLHLWPLDKLRITAEDKHRSKLYKDNMLRDQVRRKTINKESFLKSLNIKTDIRPAKNFERLSQLTWRVNQFRFKDIRWSENKLKNFQVAQNHQKIYEVKVSDRLGDYGVVGVILISVRKEQLELFEFCLSCRALGKNIEINIIQFLQKLAKKYKCSEILINALITEKNHPAIQFLKAIKEKDIQYKKDNIVCRIPLEKLCVLKNTISGKIPQNLASKHVRNKVNYKLISQIDWKFQEAELVLPSGLPSQSNLIKVWETILKRKYNKKSEFLGQASSLELVFLAAKIYEVFGFKIYLSEMLKLRNINKLANYLSNKKPEESKKKSVNKINIAARNNYPLTIQQESLYTSIKLHGENLYKVAHVWDFGFVSNVKLLEQKIWEMVKSIPELRATLDHLEHIVIHEVKDTDKSSFVKIIKCNKYQVKEILTDFYNYHSSLLQLPTSQFVIFSHENKKATVALIINHLFFDQYSIENYINNYLQTRKKKELEKFSNLAEYSFQEKMLLNHVGNKNINYFYKELSSGVAFEFPTLATRKEIYNINTFEFEIPEKVFNQLASLNKKLDISLFELNFSALSWLLFHYHNLKDPYIIGVAVSTRDIIGSPLDKLFGPVFNLIPTKLSFPNKNCTIKNWIKQISKLLRKNEEHKIFHAKDLIKKLNLRRIKGKHPFFPVAIIWHETKLLTIKNNDFLIEGYNFNSNYTEFDMLVYINKLDKGLKFKIDYAKELYPTDQIQSFADALQNILKNLQEINLGQKLSQIDILPKNFSPKYYPAKNYNILQSSVWELIQQQIIKNSKNLAIETQVESITYGDLEQITAAYATYLQDNFKENYIIALNISDRLHYVFALLGALRVGLSIIPLTNEIYNYLISLESELGNSIPVLTDKIDNSLKGSLANIHLLPMPIPKAINNEYKKPKLNTIAYRIYTSGSTGIPKAVEIPQQALVNVLHDFYRRLDTNASTKMLAHTSQGFDIAFLEILLPLISGGCCVLADQKLASDPYKLANFIDKMACNLLQATPTVWQLLLDAGWANPNQARLISGGEKLTEALAIELKKISSEVWNVYGPTEATIWSMTYLIESPNRIRLGHPISNTYCYVRNALELPSFPGSFGELIISGKGVANGYWNEPAKTMQSFIADNYSKQRMYKTGDIVYIDPCDNSLIYIERKDRQIKLHGRRIELAEIENALNSQPYVQRAAVVALLSDNGYRVHGYLQLKNKKTSSERIRSDMLKQYPSQFIPNIFHLIDKMPINTNGKVDYKALLELSKNIKPASNKIIKSTKLFNWVKRWCRSHLFIQNINVNDNFFDMGGNSILAIKLATELSLYTNKKIKVTDIFKYASIGELASVIETNFSQQNTLIETLSVSESIDKIAIVGLAIKVPQINTPDEFFDLLKNKGCTIEKYAMDDLTKFGVVSKLLKTDNFMPVSSHLSDYMAFDANFFDMSPREAEQTDPQHRILLELSWQALEDAGIKLDEKQNNIGIYASCANNNYLSTYLANIPENLSRERLSLEIVSESAFLATKIAYKLSLCGPAVSINTTCSSGLTCVTEACKSLLIGEAETMIAAAASVTLDNQIGYLYEQGHIFSKSGMCKPFTIESDGTVPGSGAVAVVLKRLSSAIKDNNPIYAVIEGFSTNNDGKRKATYTSPSITGHAECIQKALYAGHVDPNHIAFIEAHGTGTHIGDPIEIEAFKEAYGKLDATCWIGTVKANVGHTNTAAGLVGLAKLCLSRKNKLLIGNPNNTTPIAALDDHDGHFKLLTEIMPWPKNKPYAGISSLGIGGTNNHLVIGPAPEIKIEKINLSKFVLTLSAKNLNSLNLMKAKIYNFINNDLASDLEKIASLCYTLLYKRQHFEERFICIFQDINYLSKALNSSENFFIESQLKSSRLINLATKWLKLKTVDWKEVFSEEPRPLHVPTYGFNHNVKYDIRSSKADVAEAIAQGNESAPSSMTLLKEIFGELLGYRNLSNTDSFFDLGGDSLGALDLIAHIEKKFAITISMDDIHTSNSIEKLTNLIQIKQAQQPTIELIKLNNSIDKPVLILIHPGNGNVYHYRPVAKLLAKAFQIYAVSYPIGREKFSSIKEMAHNYIELISEQLKLTNGYYLGGWSYGATVAHEMVHQLENTHKKLPSKLFLIDGWAHFNNNLLKKNHFFDAFFEAADLIGKNTPENNLWLNVFWEKISNRMRILIEHEPSIIHLDTLLIKAKNYPKYYVAENLANNGWESYIKNSLTTYIVEGDHNKMIEQPYLNQIIEIFLQHA